MTPPQREWKIGSSTLHFEPPDILWAEFQGMTSLEDAILLVELYRELSRSGPFFLVGDMKQGATIDAEGRCYLSENAPPDWVHGTIYIGARLAQKALVKGLMLAAHLAGRAEQSAVAKVHFVSTKAEAYELVARLRVQHSSRVA
ncbi:MAG TPA: hypothetical protein VEU33_05785 [Archangium sp.]|nr:hypothetical protein [Archangium sp.]